MHGRQRTTQMLSSALIVATAALSVGVVAPAAQANAPITDFVAVDVPVATWSDIAYGNGRYVAVASAGSGARSVTSTDGFTWVDAGLPSLSWRFVSFCSGRFFASTGGGAGPNLYTSTDGTTWSAVAGSIWAAGLACNGSQLVVINQGWTGSTARAYSSPDGVTWTGGTITHPTDPIAWSNILWTDVVFANGRYVAVSGFDLDSPRGRVMTSEDGNAWTIRTVPDLSRQWDSIAYGNGVFVAVSYGSAVNVSPPGGPLAVMTSTDGLTWTLRSSADAAVLWERVRFTDGRFVAAGSWGGDPMRRIMTSTDGITWTLEPATSSEARWRAFALAPGQFAGITGASSNRQIWVSGGAQSPTVRASNPASWITINQALPARPDGSCDGIDDAHVAYGTELTGGWAPTWHDWVGGAGGPACIRSLVNRGSGWTLGPGS